MTHSPTDLRIYREEAAEVARLGGAELRRLYGQGIPARDKTSGRDLVTEADLASERAILAFIEARHPEHGWQSEEAGERPGGGTLRWVIDPLDGTGNFAHGYPQFSVSVALLDGDRSIAGAVYDPLRDECFDAALGLGATLNGRALRTSACTELANALVSTGFPYDPERRRRYGAVVLGALAEARFLRRAGSAALDCAYVAAGRAEAHFEFGLSLHDIAAGLLLVSEVGGVTEEMTFADWPLGYLAADGPAVAGALHALVNAHLGPTGFRPAAVVGGGGA